MTNLSDDEIIQRANIIKALVRYAQDEGRPLEEVIAIFTPEILFASESHAFRVNAAFELRTEKIEERVGSMELAIASIKGKTERLDSHISLVLWKNLGGLILVLGAIAAIVAGAHSVLKDDLDKNANVAPNKKVVVPNEDANIPK